MAAWKMIGFPGTHYDYRDWIDRHNRARHIADYQYRRSSKLVSQ